MAVFAKPGGGFIRCQGFVRQKLVNPNFQA